MDLVILEDRRYLEQISYGKESIYMERNKWFTDTLNLELKKRIMKCLICSRRRLEAFEM